MFHSTTIDRSDLMTNEAQRYSELLLAEKARVQSDLRGRLEMLHNGYLAIEDQASVLHEQFVSIRFNNFAYEKIKAIDGALERLKRGQYGVCEGCDEEISEKRLKAVPWTRFCLHCQEKSAALKSSPVFERLRVA